jgi:hypothetical protein
MRDFNVFVDEMTDNTRPGAVPAYQIALSPSSRGGGAMGTRAYSSKDVFVADLQQRLGYTGRAIERFFADPERHNTLLNHSLSDEDAVYFGWHPDYDRH